MQSPFDEDVNRPNTEEPNEFTMWTASKKSTAVLEDLKTDSNSPDYVIGADTVVFLNNNIIGKPKDLQHATEMLKM